MASRACTLCHLSGGYFPEAGDVCYGCLARNESNIIVQGNCKQCLQPKETWHTPQIYKLGVREFGSYCNVCRTRTLFHASGYFKNQNELQNQSQNELQSAITAYQNSEETGIVIGACIEEDCFNYMAWLKESTCDNSFITFCDDCNKMSWFDVIM